MTAKKTARKVARKKTGNVDTDVVRRHDLTVHYLPIDSVSPYPDNPNIGGAEEAIDESLDANGLYRAILIQKSTNFILAGNHTWEQLKLKGATEVGCTILDVDDTEARRIVIGDNEISKLARTSAKIQAKLIAELPDHLGTGISEEDFDLMRRMEQSAMEEMEETTETGLLAEVHRQAMGGIDAPEGEDDDDREVIGGEEHEPPAGPEFDEVSEDLAGMFQLKDDTMFESKHWLGIPPLRPDMMCTELPDNLTVWAGSATAHMDDPTINWFYNYGVDSTSGMKQPLDHILMAFYTHDDYFECWWDNPVKYVSRLLNSKITTAVAPNFSQYTNEPYMINLWNLYRSRWVARYMQEAGIKIIPDLRWRGGADANEYIDKYMAYGLPSEVPIASIELQTSVLADEAIADKAADEIEYAVKKCNVKHLIVYAGKPGNELMKQKVVLPKGSTWEWLPNRSIPLAEKAKTRQKKTTI